MISLKSSRSRHSDVKHKRRRASESVSDPPLPYPSTSGLAAAQTDNTLPLSMRSSCSASSSTTASSHHSLASSTSNASQPRTTAADTSVTFAWSVDASTLTQMKRSKHEQGFESAEFSIADTHHKLVRGLRWKLELYPNGWYGDDQGQCKLALTCVALPENVSKVFACVTLCCVQTQTRYVSTEQFTYNGMQVWWRDGTMLLGRLQSLPALRLECRIEALHVHYVHNERAGGKAKENLVRLHRQVAFEWSVDESLMREFQGASVGQLFCSPCVGFFWLQLIPNGYSADTKGRMKLYLESIGTLPSGLRRIAVRYRISCRELQFEKEEVARIKKRGGYSAIANFNLGRMKQIRKLKRMTFTCRIQIESATDMHKTEIDVRQWRKYAISSTLLDGTAPVDAAGDEPADIEADDKNGDERVAVVVKEQSPASSSSSSSSSKTEPALSEDEREQVVHVTTATTGVLNANAQPINHTCKARVLSSSAAESSMDSSSTNSHRIDDRDNLYQLQVSDALLPSGRLTKTRSELNAIQHAEEESEMTESPPPIPNFIQEFAAANHHADHDPTTRDSWHNSECDLDDVDVDVHMDMLAQEEHHELADIALTEQIIERKLKEKGSKFKILASEPDASAEPTSPTASHHTNDTINVDDDGIDKEDDSENDCKHTPEDLDETTQAVDEKETETEAEIAKAFGRFTIEATRSSSLLEESTDTPQLQRALSPGMVHAPFLAAHAHHSNSNNNNNNNARSTLGVPQLLNALSASSASISPHGVANNGYVGRFCVSSADKTAAGAISVDSMICFDDFKECMDNIERKLNDECKQCEHVCSDLKQVQQHADTQKHEYLQRFECIEKAVQKMTESIQHLKTTQYNIVTRMSLSESERETIHLKQTPLKLWLCDKLQLSEYYSVFVEQGFEDMLTLCYLNDSDLMQLGVLKLAHRKKLLHAIEMLRKSFVVSDWECNTRTSPMTGSAQLCDTNNVQDK